ncbi:MAG: hydantoinase/oxoprolinase family protein [Thermoplasmata archaeon]
MGGFKIGIDVGGTNTDSVILDRSNRLVAKAKSPTTPDVTSGIQRSLELVLGKFREDRRRIRYCMLGTTHAINAILERKGLDRVAILRIGSPVADSIPPLADWPRDLAAAVRFRTYLLGGGHEFDGRTARELDRHALERIAAEIDGSVSAIAVTAVFSPVQPQQEIEAGRILVKRMRHRPSISLSHNVATIGLLERENATILNSSLRSVSRHAINAFRDAARRLGLKCSLYLGQNDGTLMDVPSALAHPILTVASGPTNSIRGAAFVAGVRDAIVVDVGGTSTDIGLLKGGFPLESARPATIGGVRTNFRMPDLLSLALGGGSRVRPGKTLTVGPDSVGFRLTEEALAFGGSTLTTTDVAVALKRCELGDPGRLTSLPRSLLSATDRLIRSLVEEGIERVLTSPVPLPVVLVGGGSVLIGTKLKGASRIVRPSNYEVANAIGVATAEIGADVDTITTYGSTPRTEILAQVRQSAIDRVVAAGANPRKTRIANVEEIPISYLPGNAVRVRVKACGVLAD